MITDEGAARGRLSAAPGTPGPEARQKGRRKRHQRTFFATAGAVVAGIVALIVALTLAGSFPGPSLAQLTDQVEDALTPPYHALSSSTVLCYPPASWALGRTFRCYLYRNPDGKGLAIYTGTVEPANNAGYNWNGQWQPIR
jgi:hypothetical protein